MDSFDVVRRWFAAFNHQDLDALVASEGVDVAQEILAGREGTPDSGVRPDRALQGQGGPVGAGDPGREKNHPGAHVAPRLSDLPALEDLVPDPMLPEAMRQEDPGRPTPDDDDVLHDAPSPSGMPAHPDPV